MLVNLLLDLLHSQTFVLCVSLLLITPLSNGQHNSASRTILSWVANQANHQEWIKVAEDKDSTSVKPFLDGTVDLPLTVFMPIDEEIQKTSRKNWIASHIVMKASDAANLYKTGDIVSLDQNAPKLRFSQGINSTTGQTVIYVLNAKIIESHQIGKSWVHIIDRVLDIPKSVTSSSPSGLEWIHFPGLYEPSYLNNNGFSALINETQSGSKFDDCKACTFFVPQNVDNVRGAVTQDVLLGHVVENEILFLRPMNVSTPYKTKAHSPQLTVTLSKEVRHGSNNEEITYIQALSKGSNSNIKLGSTRVKVIRADIPVNNGVVHIIEKPLVVTDISIIDYLREEGKHTLKQFFYLLESLPNLQRFYQRSEFNRPLTIFAFNNEAYEAVAGDIDAIRNNATMFEDLLKLHFVDGESVTSHNAEEIKERPSLAGNKKLTFSVSDGNLYVEGEGVKASAVVQDIAATNGVIHIINKVLGIPSSPIKDKLREDPQLRTTYRVASKGGPDWLNNLSNRERNFTFFAPSEVAWKKLSVENPSAYKQLVEGLYEKNTEAILNRHLVLDSATTLEDLSKLGQLKTVNSIVQIENVSTSGQLGVALKYMQETATITRGNIKAINGLIHEIDRILMQDSDLSVSSQLARDVSSSIYSRHISLTSLMTFFFIIIKLF